MTNLMNQSAKALKSYIDRIEKLNDEKATITEDIAEVFAEAKANGFDVKIMRELIRIRKKDLAERQEWAYMLTTYASNVGMTEISEAFGQEETEKG